MQLLLCSTPATTAPPPPPHLCRHGSAPAGLCWRPTAEAPWRKPTSASCWRPTAEAPWRKPTSASCWRPTAASAAGRSEAQQAWQQALPGHDTPPRRRPCLCHPQARSVPAVLGGFRHLCALLSQRPRLPCRQCRLCCWCLPCPVRRSLNASPCLHAASPPISLNAL